MSMRQTQQPHHYALKNLFSTRKIIACVTIFENFCKLTLLGKQILFITLHPVGHTANALATLLHANTSNMTADTVGTTIDGISEERIAGIR